MTMGSVQESRRPNAISVTLQELQDGSVSLQTLEEAFGPDSLGIIIVRDLPRLYPELRKSLLSYSSYLANLPQDELVKLERPDTKYNVGWACGKETLTNGRYDTLKGSYYVRPIHDDILDAKATSLYPDVPEMTAANVWPNEDVLPGFQRAFEDLCRLIVDIAALVARSCDRYGTAKVDNYRPGTLEHIVRTSVSTKARLLHYFPPAASSSASSVASSATTLVGDDNGEDDWCATHQDLGALTGLTSQMFVDEDAHPPQGMRTSESDSSASLPSLPELDSHPDPEAGLWIRDRSGRTTQVHIPRDALAFQTGSALETITQGAFKAVPHFVRGGRSGVGENSEGARRIARNTLAVFTQPNLWEKVDDKRDFASLAQMILANAA